VWIRDIFTSPRLPRWRLWQFANRGRIAGIRGPVDLNVFQGDHAAWQALLQGGGT
jgi:lysozyme